MMQQSEKAAKSSPQPQKEMKDLARWAWRLHTGRLCMTDLIANTAEILRQIELYAIQKIADGPTLLVDAERKKFVNHHPISQLLAYKIQRTAMVTNDGISGLEIAVQHIGELL